MRKPYKLIGFDIHMRLCWRWPFARIHVGRVWRIVGEPGVRAHELAP